MPSFMTAFGTGMFLINILLAPLLLSKGAIERKAEGIYLGSAYLLVAAIFIPLTLSFKDAFVPGALIGTPATSVWLWSFWHCGFGLSIGWYALSSNIRLKYMPSVGWMIGCIITIVTCISALSTMYIDWLPPLLWNGTTFFAGPFVIIPMGLITINILALILCIRLRARTSEQLWITVAMVAACCDIWLTVHGANRFALGWYFSKCGSLATSLIVLISMFFDISTLYRNSARINRTLSTLAQRDGLTGIYNRRHFDETLDIEWRRARREQIPLALLLVDVDHFKQYNDEYGHLAGDECLKAVALCITRAVRRPADLVARYGGEEFAVILPNTDLAGCLKTGENVRASIAQLALLHRASQQGVLAVSIGATARLRDFHGDPAALISLADECLYKAKRRGRNQVVGSAIPVTSCDTPASEPALTQVT